MKLLEIHQDELMKRDNFEDIMNYMKTTMPDIDASTMDKIMKDVFTMDITKQLIEYQVEYNVLQEEISTSQHYMETLNREKENYSQLESKLQVTLILIKLIFENKMILFGKNFENCQLFTVCRIKYYAIRENTFIPTNSNPIATDASAKYGNNR